MDLEFPAPCSQENSLTWVGKNCETGKLDSWKTEAPGITKIAFAGGDYLL